MLTAQQRLRYEPACMVRNAARFFAVAALAVTLCAIGSAQGRKAGAPAKAEAALALQIADFAALPITGIA